MELTILCHSLVLGPIRKMNLSQSFPSRLELVSFPLAMILPILLNIDPLSIPVKTFATSFIIRMIRQFAVFIKRLICKDKFTILVNRFLKITDTFHLNKLLESSSCKGTTGPSLDGFEVLGIDGLSFHIVSVFDTLLFS